MMSRWLGPDDARLERAAVYTFHSVVQEGWRKGRLLLAGNSCHQTPPFLGQGMCAGMRDAANLAWKLAAIIKDGAPDALLDTYESERLPHVRTFIDLAVRLGAVLQETDREAAAARDRRFEAGAEMFDFPQPQLGPGCRLDAPPPVGTDLPPAAPRRRPADGRGDRPALRHRRRRSAARRTSSRCRAAARCRPRLAARARRRGPPSCARTATSMPWRATGRNWKRQLLQLPVVWSGMFQTLQVLTVRPCRGRHGADRWPHRAGVPRQAPARPRHLLSRSRRSTIPGSPSAASSSRWR